MTLRPARAEDLEETRALIARAGLFLGGLDTQFGAQYALAVASDGAIVGVTGVETYGRYGLLRSVAVLEPWRGQGIASRLMRNRIAWARARSLDAVYLLTAGAASFYEAFGFVPVPHDAWPEPLHASEQWRSTRDVCLMSMVLTLEHAGV